MLVPDLPQQLGRLGVVPAAFLVTTEQRLDPCQPAETVDYSPSWPSARASLAPLGSGRCRRAQLPGTHLDERQDAQRDQEDSRALDSRGPRDRALGRHARGLVVTGREESLGDPGESVRVTFYRHVGCATPELERLGEAAAEARRIGEHERDRELGRSAPRPGQLPRALRGAVGAPVLPQLRPRMTASESMSAARSGLVAAASAAPSSRIALSPESTAARFDPSPEVSGLGAKSRIALEAAAAS